METAESKSKEPAYLTGGGLFVFAPTRDSCSIDENLGPEELTTLPTSRIKLLLVDDHPLVLESIHELLAPHFTISGTVPNLEDIISRALELRPDVILLDACMPGASGFAVIKQLKKLLPFVKVIVVTMLTEAISISEAFRAGASGYVLKQSASEDLHAAIESVMADKRFLSKNIEAEVQETMQDAWLRPEGYSSDLTGRQREILILLAEGRTAKQIAQQLQISTKTVEFHKANITHKVGVHTTPDLIKFALAYGITTLQQAMEEKV